MPAQPRLFAGVLALIMATVAIAATNQHAAEFDPGVASQVVRSAVPLAAGVLAAYAVFNPWRALLAILLLAPCWNAAQVSLQIGPVQLILQTIFVAALAVGTWRVRQSEPRATAAERPMARPAAAQRNSTALSAVRAWAGRFEAYRFAEVAAVGIVGLAILSTIASRDRVDSATVLLHGILEPIAIGAMIVLLRPSRRGLILLATVMGASAAIGGLINILQMLPSVSSFASLQAHRLVIARVAYVNVGLYGVVLAGVIPLIVGILGRGRLAHANRRTFALLLTILVGCMVGLFLTFSKSAYLATTAGIVMALFLLVGTWRKRVAIILSAGVLSSILIPWPALVLQPIPAAASAYRAIDIALVGESRFDSWNPATLAGHGSMAERFYAVEGGVSMALDHPLLGVGLDQFRYNYITLGYRPHAATTLVDHAHSVFPEIAAELGVPVMVLVLAALLAALWAMRRVYQDPMDRTTRALAVGLAAATVAWVIAGTAFGVDIYRAVRDQSTDVVTIVVLVAAAIALSRSVSAARRSRTAV